MMYRYKTGKCLFYVILLVLIMSPFLRFHPTYAAYLTNRIIAVDDPIANAVTNYKAGFSLSTAGTLGSIQLKFCENSPLIDESCTIPAGLDITNAVLFNQTGETGFSIDPSSTPSTIILTRTPSAALTGPVTYSFSGVINPSTPNSTVYMRILTYASADASGLLTDKGAAAFSTSGTFGTAAFVPPYLNFCVGITVSSDCTTTNGDSADFGILSTLKASSVSSQAAVATNSPTGYVLYSFGTTLTSGNNTIQASSFPNPSLSGYSQFGINLRQNNNPGCGRNLSGAGSGQVKSRYNTPDLYMFNSGDEVATSSVPSDYNVYTICYIANISNDQPAGVYVTTINFMAAAQF